MKRSAYITAFLFSACMMQLSAQDIHFSQFYMAPLSLNPAMAVAEHDLQANLNYKNQWSSVASPYKTTAFSFDAGLNRKRNEKGILAVGINFFSDKAGDAKMGTTQANISIAYHVRLNKNSLLGGGVQAGYLQRSINTTELKWGNQ